MKYIIEFELPDNDVVLSEIKKTLVRWQIWGYKGWSVAKPVKQKKKKAVEKDDRGDRALLR